MKKQSGITITSLIIYVIVMVIVIAILSSIINSFYNNNKNMSVNTDEIIEFNKFNMYFLKEVKKAQNKVEDIKENYILFSSGNVFSFYNNKIYYNDIEICKDINNLSFKTAKNGDGIDNTIIYVTLTIKDFTKSINYKIEEIY